MARAVNALDLPDNDAARQSPTDPAQLAIAFPLLRTVYQFLLAPAPVAPPVAHDFGTVGDRLGRSRRT